MAFHSYRSTWFHPLRASMTNTTHPNPKSSTPPIRYANYAAADYEQHGRPDQAFAPRTPPRIPFQSARFRHAMFELEAERGPQRQISRATQTGAEHVYTNSGKAVDSS